MRNSLASPSLGPSDSDRLVRRTDEAVLFLVFCSFVVIKRSDAYHRANRRRATVPGFTHCPHRVAGASSLATTLPCHFPSPVPNSPGPANTHRGPQATHIQSATQSPKLVSGSLIQAPATPTESLTSPKTDSVATATYPRRQHACYLYWRALFSRATRAPPSSPRRTRSQTGWASRSPLLLR